MIIRIEVLVESKDRIRNWRLLSLIAIEGVDWAGQGLRGWRTVLRAPKSQRGGTIEGGSRIFHGKHVFRFIPSTAQDVALAARLIPSPLLNIAGHIVGAVWSQPLMATDSCRALSIKIAEPQNVRGNAQARCFIPVINRGQTFAHRLTIGGSFIPAHSSYRKITLSIGVRSQLPCRRRDGPSDVLELTQGFLP